MGTTVEQDKRFLSEMIGEELLEKAIEWIAGNFSPEEVFDEGPLETWAKSEGWVKE